MDESFAPVLQQQAMEKAEALIDQIREMDGQIEEEIFADLKKKTDWQADGGRE